MNKIQIFPQVASVQEMQRNYRKLLDTVKSSKNPLFILRNNVPEAVIIDIFSWNKIAEKFVQKEYKDAEKAIKNFKKEKKQRKLKTLKGSLVDLMK